MLVKPSIATGPPKSVKPFLSRHLQNRSYVGFLIVFSVVLHGGLLLLPMPQWWLHSVAPEPEPEIGADLEQSGAISLTNFPLIAKPEPEPEPTIPVIPEVPQPTIESPPLVQIPEELIEEIREEQEEELVEVIDEEFELEPDPPLENTDNDQLEADTTNNEPEAGIATPFNDDFPHIAGRSQAVSD